MHSTNLSAFLGFQVLSGTVWDTSQSLTGFNSCCVSRRQGWAYRNTLRSQRTPLLHTAFTKSLSWDPPSQPSSNTVRASSTEPLVLTEENVNFALDEAREKLGSMFGNSKENQNVGITGDVYLASLDGPIVVLGLAGRFWHKREDVLARISAHLMERIPEICEIEIEHPDQLDDSDKQSSMPNM